LILDGQLMATPINVQVGENLYNLKLCLHWRYLAPYCM
jgi:hypothetical protein